MHPLYFIRHGQTDWNNAARLQGQTDTQINANGQQQGRDNGKRLRDLLIERHGAVDAVTYVASPLTRTRQTMELLREACGLPVAGYDTDDRLREISFGSWEGMTRPEIMEADRENYLSYRADRWAYRPPNAESYEELSRRVIEWLDSRNGPTVCVSHGGCLRAVQGHVLNITPQDIPKLQIPQDQIFTWIDGAVAWV